jgi:hypothetical protein
MNVRVLLLGLLALVLLIVPVDGSWARGGGTTHSSRGGSGYQHGWQGHPSRETWSRHGEQSRSRNHVYGYPWTGTGDHNSWKDDRDHHDGIESSNPPWGGPLNETGPPW